MLKQTITYEGWDGEQVTRDLFFNLTKTEIMDNLGLEQETEAMGETFTQAGKEGRNLSPVEIKQMLTLIKKLMKLSYGIRHDDGRFEKAEDNPDVWTHFTQTPAYDAFLFSLFQNDGVGAVDWMINILPRDLREGEMADQIADVRRQVAAQEQPSKGPNTVELPTAPPVLEQSEFRAPEVQGEVPLEQLSRQELLEMPQHRFDALVGTDPMGMSQEHLQIAFQRKNQQK